MDLEWKKMLSASSGELKSLSVGDSILSIQKKENRWLIEQTNSLFNNLLKKENTKNIYASKDKELVFLPSLPAFPVVLKSKHGIFLMPHEKINLYVPVPVWVQIYGAKQRPSDLMYEFPAFHLSDTWFGEPQLGEKAYSIHFEDSFFDQTIPGQYRVLCPVEVHNASDQKLEFHRFALRAMYLNVYEGPNGLIANKTKIKFKGEDQVSDISYEKKSPGSTFILMNTPREVMPSKFMGRSFSFSTKTAITN